MHKRPATIRRTLSLFLAVWFSLSPFLNELLKHANAAPVVGAPVVSTTVVQVGVSTRVTVDCPVTMGPGDPAIVSVQLQRVDGEGRLVKLLATLQGKPYGGQGLFTGHLTVKESTPGEMRLRCSVIFKNNPEPVVSPVTIISILPATVNQPPFFTSTPVTTATKNVAYSYQATAQDPEKDKVTFSLASGPKGMKIGQTTGLVQWTPTQIGSQNVQLRVTDTKKASSTQSFTIRVGDGTVNQPPFFTSSPVTNATEGVAYSYQAAAQDPENGALAFSLVSGPSGMTVGQTTGLVQWTPTHAQLGNQSVQLKVADPQNASATQSFSVNVSAATVNQPPFFTSTAITNATVNVAYSYQAAAQDPEGGALSFSVVSGPSGLTIGQTTGLVQWTPSQAQTGDNAVTLRVADPLLATGDQSFTIRVGGAAENQPPAFTSTPVTSATETVAYTYQAAAQDPEGGALTYSVVSGPSGLTIGQTSGLVQWTPTHAQVGDQAVQLKVTDPLGAAGNQNFTIKVAELNLAPIITSVPQRYAKTTEDYVYDVTAFDPEKQAVAFSFATPQPAGMTLDPATGALRWRAAANQVGTLSISIRATDPKGAFDTQTYTLTAFDPANDLQIISPSGPLTAAVGQSLVAPLQANYAGALFAVEPLPKNASVAGGNFNFKPAGDQEGVQTVIVRAAYGDMQKSVIVPITVTRDNTAPLIASIAAQTVQEGKSLNFTVSATDAENDQLTYSAPGLNIANAFFNTFTQQFTFNPALGQAGKYQVTFFVSDGRTTSQTTVTIQVTPGQAQQQALDLAVDPTPNPTFQSNLTISGSITGQTAPPPTQGLALITGLSPASAKQGQTRTVQIVGLNTKFAQGASTANFGDGVKVNSLTVNSPTSAQAEIVVDKLAALGVRTVKIAGAGGEVPSVVGFSIEKGAATITGVVVDPFTQQPIANARVAVEGTNIFVLTDSQGRFTLTGVPTGSVPLIVTLPNYAVQRLSLAIGPNDTVNLDAPITLRALARPPNFAGLLPRAATVASVLDRGVSGKGGGLTLDQAKAVIQDTMIAVGGIEAGVLDENGNQLNPKFTGAGQFSLTQEGVENHGKGMMRGDVVTLKDFVNVLRNAFNLSDEFTVSLMVEGLQKSVDEAWADPGDPQSGMAIVLFNEGTTLSANPPVVTPDTRFNSFQIFLLTSSFLVFNQTFIEPSIETILTTHGVDFNALMPPPRFSQASTPEESRFAWLDYLKQAWSAVKEWILPSAYAQAQPTCPNGVSPCTIGDLQARNTYSKVYRTIGAGAIVESAKAGLIATGIALMQFVATQMVMGFLMGPLAPGIAIGATMAGLALAFTAGAVATLMFKLVLGWYIAQVAASSEPTPPTSRGTSTDPLGNFVIKFNLSPEHVRSIQQPTQIKRRYVYHLYRVPDCGFPVDAGKTEYVAVKETPDYTDPGIPHAHQFVVPKLLLRGGQNCFRIRVFQYIPLFEKELVEGVEVYDNDNDGQLSLLEFINGGLGDNGTFDTFDLNHNGRIDATEFNNFQQTKAPPTELQVVPGVPLTSENQRIVGQTDLQPSTYPGQVQTTTINLKDQVAVDLSNVHSRAYSLRNAITDVDFKSPNANVQQAVPQLQTFVDNLPSFRNADDIVNGVNSLPAQTTPEADAAFAQQLADTSAQSRLGRSATVGEIVAVQDMIASKRAAAVILTRMDTANKIAADLDPVINQVKTGTGTFQIEYNDYQYNSATGYTLVPTSETVTSQNASEVLGRVELVKTRAVLGRQQILSDSRKVVNTSFNKQVPDILKSGLQTTTGKSPQEIDQLFGDYLSSKNGAAVRGLATARVADENKESLDGLIQRMKERRAGPLTINEPPLDPSIVNIQKSTGTFLNFGGQAIAGSSALLTYLQSVQILSSDFSPDCFTSGGPSLPPPSNFPPTFEPFPGFEEPSAVIREAVDPNNPKDGFLTREYPADDDNTDSVDAGFPPGFIGVDAQNRIIAINRNSTDRFGGRIFRFTLAKSQPSGGGRRTFAVQKRELVGAVNYFSIDIQIAHPALPVALVVGPKFPATTQSGDPIMTQDLFIADTDIVTNQKRILQVAISQIDTIASFYTDPITGGEMNRNHIVGQPVVVSDEFRLTGPSDMEVGPDLAFTEPRNTPNSVVMLSDEDIIWAITHDSLGTYNAVKVLQVPGRRWSGLAFDDQGKFYFADYAAKEIFAMSFSQFTEAVASSIKNNAPLISSDPLLRQFSARVGVVDHAPGDIEIEQISTHPGGVLHVSTEHGIVPINMPIVGQVGPNVREIHIKRMAGEEVVPIETAFASPIRTFRAVPSHEDLEALKVTLSIKRVDLNGREVWNEQGVFLAAHGATFLDLQ